MSHFCHVTFLTRDFFGRAGNKLPPNDNIGDDSCAQPDNSILPGVARAGTIVANASNYFETATLTEQCAISTLLSHFS